MDDQKDQKESPEGISGLTEIIVGLVIILSFIGVVLFLLKILLPG